MLTNVLLVISGLGYIGIKEKTTQEIQSLYLNPYRISVFEKGKVRLHACIREIQS